MSRPETDHLWPWSLPGALEQIPPGTRELLTVMHRALEKSGAHSTVVKATLHTLLRGPLLDADCHLLAVVLADALGLPYQSSESCEECHSGNHQAESTSRPPERTTRPGRSAPATPPAAGGASPASAASEPASD